MDKTENLFHPVQIGNLFLSGNIFLAPVAGYSDTAFRSICSGFGAAFSYTEMVSAEALIRDSAKTERLMRRAPGEKKYAVQLFGPDPEHMKEAVKIVLQKTDADCIDINAGCPVPKIVKTGAGSALTRNPEKLFQIVKASLSAVKEFSAEYNRAEIPVTVKIRSGWDEKNITWKEAAEAALEAGAGAVTLHPRTRKQGYEGKADWELIKQLVVFARKKFPTAGIFGSGDLFSPVDAAEMLKTTGCAAVMFARGALGNPFIFRQTLSLLTTGQEEPVSDSEKIKTSWQEFLLLKNDLGEKSAALEMRKRFCAYTKGIKNGAKLRNHLVLGKSEAEFRSIFENAGFNIPDNSNGPEGQNSLT